MHASNTKKNPVVRRQSSTESTDDMGNVACLISVGGSRRGCKYAIRTVTTIGRGNDCDIVVDSSECSRRHAEVSRAADGYTVTDLGSRNGTIVNGNRIDGTAALAFGDRLRIGPKDVFLFTPHDPLEEQLLHRHRLETLGRLSAGVAHDLNNMLGAVTASVAFLRELPTEARGGKDANACLVDIHVAATHAAELASRLLTFATASGKHSPVNISDVAREAVVLARRTFERSVKIVTNVAPEVFIFGDATQIHQVIMNLLVNARDSLEGKGTITVLVSPGADGFAELSVKDDGCGMDEPARRQIFEPFYTTKRPGRGFGLGLSTVSDIVRAHRGVISVTSAPGAGASFDIGLPRALRPVKKHESPTLDDTEDSGLATKGIRVALVDDEPVMRRSLARVLRCSGFRVRSFESGEDLMELVTQALLEDERPTMPGEADVPGSSDAWAEQVPADHVPADHVPADHVPGPSNTVEWSSAQLPHAVVLDLDLIGITGEETLRRLRALGVHVPVVCISGHHNPSRQQEVNNLGASAFLAKPFEPSKLIRALLDAVAPDANSTPPSPRTKAI